MGGRHVRSDPQMECRRGVVDTSGCGDGLAPLESCRTRCVNGRRRRGEGDDAVWAAVDDDRVAEIINDRSRRRTGIARNFCRTARTTEDTEEKSETNGPEEPILRLSSVSSVVQPFSVPSVVQLLLH